MSSCAGSHRLSDAQTDGSYLQADVPAKPGRGRSGNPSAVSFKPRPLVEACGTRPGSPIARVPLPISCDVLPAREGDRMHFRQWRRREFITLLGGLAACVTGADPRRHKM